jgi:UDP-glucose 4-epimerase
VHGLRAAALRYFNAAGCDPDGELGERHDPETHLIPLVLLEALRVQRGGDPAAGRLEVFGDRYATRDGTCIRDYVHVNDLCAAHLLALDRLLAGKGTGFEACNLGVERGYSVKEIIDAARRVTGVDIRYRVAPPRAGDPPALVASAARAREWLGWNPAYDAIDAIIGTAWEWFRKAA